MKVKELIKILSKENPERVVVLSMDEEGNGFSPLSGVQRASFDEDEQNIGIEELTDDHKEEGYSEYDLLENGIPALVLWP
jgi:hypothetical protein